MTQIGILFHGSPCDKLEVLTPAPTKVLGGQLAVFASNTLWIALIFAARPPAGEIDFGFINDTPYIAELSPDAFCHLRKRGIVCIVDAEGFTSDCRLGMPRHEFVNSTNVEVKQWFPVDCPLDCIRKWFPRVSLVLDADREQFYKDNHMATTTEQND